MVYFKDKSSPSGEHHLIILDDQHKSIEKGTILAVYAPLVGGRNVAWTLRATHHELPCHQQSNDLAPLRTLGRFIVEGDAKWDGDLQFIGDFHYTRGYWEWTEDVLSRCGKRLRLISAYDAVYASLFTYDHNSNIIKAFCEAWCPLTNTLLTSAGELSISLWDLHDLAGLPITGCLYDEVVPSALELTGVDKKGGRFIPRSSKYLLYAYHLLQGADDDQCSNMFIDKWVKFWSKKAIKYHLPPHRKEKKMVRPKSTHNPLGDITTHKRWSTAEEALFEKLYIEGNLKEEVYLAAYLACWLCTFVLPGKDVNSIRPSTFKMASMMTSGRRVSLISILASIYEGLNTIAISSRPARTSPSFPVHFVYAWLAYYFKTHYLVWQGLRGPKMTRFSGEGGAKYYDPQEARKWVHKVEFVFWACNMIVKNRPFKFIDNGDAEEPDHDYFIAICSSYFTLRQGDKFIIEPYSPHRFGHQFGDSSNKDRHWKRQKKELTPLKAVEASASRSPSADFIAQLEDKIQSINASEESETSHSWTTTLPPFGMGLKGKQLPQPPAVSVHEGESFLFNHHKEFLQKIWSDLLVKISNTPVDFLSSIEDDVSFILESIKNFHKFDITKVEELLNTFFVKVHDEARSLSPQKLSRSLHEQHLKEAKACLQDVQAKASERASKVQSIVDELEHVEKEIVALKGRRTSLCAALKEQKQLNHDAQAKVHEVEEDIATLENTAPLGDAIVENSKANLEVLKEDLKSLNLLLEIYLGFYLLLSFLFFYFCFLLCPHILNEIT
ncbi:UNVERIFIED_CONTAM: hypothetical protein Slati_1508700 [Sesamum latifolium]|uniref:Aminotransferase-like plant mobile domain-containing protein n=1 Tax=Sesamum latifolium TaxID=2727402 RepID=A0AAW2X6Q6_9LAMI